MDTKIKNAILDSIIDLEDYNKASIHINGIKIDLSDLYFLAEGGNLVLKNYANHTVITIYYDKIIDFEIEDGKDGNYKTVCYIKGGELIELM